jgi:hypothetical protein
MLQAGEASKVAPVDKLSIVLVAVFAFTFLDERPSLREWTGIAMVAGGVLLLALRRQSPDGAVPGADFPATWSTTFCHCRGWPVSIGGTLWAEPLRVRKPAFTLAYRLSMPPAVRDPMRPRRTKSARRDTARRRNGDTAIRRCPAHPCSRAAPGRRSARHHPVAAPAQQPAAPRAAGPPFPRAAGGTSAALRPCCPPDRAVRR